MEWVILAGWVVGFAVLMFWQDRTHRKLMKSLDAGILRLRAMSRLTGIVGDGLRMSSEFGADEGVAWMRAEIEGDTWREIEALVDEADALMDEVFR